MNVQIEKGVALPTLGYLAAFGNIQKTFANKADAIVFSVANLSKFPFRKTAS
jgi:hypothetical protein